MHVSSLMTPRPLSRLHNASPSAPKLAWAVAAVATLAAAVFGWLAVLAPTAPATTTWTTIPAPVSGFPRGSSPSVSPDGSQMAFAALDENGQSHLWLRTLSEQSARRLPGTETPPRHSGRPTARRSDSSRIQKLQVLAISGNTPRVIASVAGNFRGGTWNRDDVIVLCGTGIEPVPRVRIVWHCRGAADGVCRHVGQSVDVPELPSGWRQIPVHNLQ